MKKKRISPAKYKPGASGTADIEKPAFTPREMEVLQLLDEGLVEKEIAARLHISLNTVKWHISNCFDKPEVHNARSLVKKMRNYGILK